MASTNKTPHYGLSQFVESDKPSWMTDYNSDMLKIDTGISAAQDAATAAATLANQAQQAGNAASSAVESMQTSIEQTHDLAESAVVTAGQALSEAEAAQNNVHQNSIKIVPMRIQLIKDLYFNLTETNPNSGPTANKQYKAFISFYLPHNLNSINTVTFDFPLNIFKGTPTSVVINSSDSSYSQQTIGINQGTPTYTKTNSYYRVEIALTSPLPLPSTNSIITLDITMSIQWNEVTQ